MYNSKYFKKTLIAAILINSLGMGAYNTASAKDVADVWPYEIQNNSYTYDGKAITLFNGSVIPLNLDIGNDVNYAGGSPYYLDVKFTNLRLKGIQSVSFIRTVSLREIGGDGAYSGIFNSNEIRKIYWNSSDKYQFDIKIGPSAFYNNHIQSLDLPTKVTSIQSQAFSNNEISWVKGLDNVTEILPQAFANNKIVSSLPNGYKFELPKKMTYINNGIFKNNLLTDLTIPIGYTQIAPYAFEGNPLKSVYLENQNIIIDNQAFGVPSPDLLIYGHGEESTAATFAKKWNLKYVNVNQLEWYVIDAEESQTLEKLNLAYEKINAMEESQLKKNYLDRLDNVKKSFDVGPYVTKAETTLNIEDYKIAKQKVSELSEGLVKTNYEKRLEAVINKINAALNEKLKEYLGKLEGDDDITNDDLDKIKTQIDELTNPTDQQALLDRVKDLEGKANRNTYFLAEQQTKHTEEYQTLKNLLAALKTINSLPDGYELPEDTTKTKQKLLDRINAISPEIYSLAALEKAKQTLLEEDIDDAKVLAYYLEEGDTKERVLKELEDLEKQLSTYNALFDLLNEKINRHKVNGSPESYKEISGLTHTIGNPYLENKFTDKLNEADYINKINKIILEAEIFGLSEQNRLDLLAYLSLIDPDGDDYSKLLERAKPLIEQYDNYTVDYLKILTEIEKSRDSLTQLSIDKYSELRELVLALPENNEYKDELLKEMNKLKNQMTDIQKKLDEADLLKADISSLNDVVNNITELKNIVKEIKSIDEKEIRNILQEELDKKLKDLSQDIIEKTIENNNTITNQTLENIKEYINSISNETIRETIVNDISDKLLGKIKSTIDTKGIEDLINKNFTLYQQEIDKLKELLNKDDKAEIENYLDQKIDYYIQNTYDSSSEMSEKVLDEISKLYNLITDESKKTANETLIEGLIQKYINVVYDGYDDNALSKDEYNKLITLLNKFEDFDYKQIEYQKIIDVQSEYLSKVIDEKLTNLDFKNKEELNELINKTNQIQELLLKDDVNKKIAFVLTQKLNDIDLNDKNALDQILSILGTINNLNYVDESLEETFNKVLEKYFNTHPIELIDLSKDTEYEDRIGYILNNYLSEETISKMNINWNINGDSGSGSFNNGFLSEKEITNNIEKINKDLQRVIKTNENLLTLIKNLNTEKGIVSNSYQPPKVIENGANTIDNHYNYQNVYRNIYKELGEKENNSLVSENYSDSYRNINDVKEKIDNIGKNQTSSKQTKEMVKEISFISKSIDKIDDKLENIEKKNKSIINLFTVMGSSNLGLILISFGTLLGLNLKNRRRMINMQKENKESQETIEELKNNIEDLKDINLGILNSLNEQKDKKEK